MRLLSLIFLLGFSGLSQKSQSRKIVSGVLILSPWRDHTSFDLFVPGNINNKKCLLSNLDELIDTAIRVGTYKEGLIKSKMLAIADTITNESTGLPSQFKTILILPVEVEYEEDEVMRGYPDEFYSFNIIINGKRIISTYNNKKPLFKKIKILFLPKKGCG